MLHYRLRGENLFDFYEKSNKFGTSQKHYILTSKRPSRTTTPIHRSRHAVSGEPFAELAADALPAAAGGLSGGGACITSSNKLDERCSKGNKTCSKGKLSYPSNIGKISNYLTHNTLQKQDMFKWRKNLPFQHKT